MKRQSFISTFVKNAKKHPNVIAFKYLDGGTLKEVSYDELNRSANRLARHLKSVYDPKSKRIAILYERSYHLLMSMLAIWKLGYSFILLDPNDLSNEDKIKHVLVERLEITKPDCLLTKRDYSVVLKEHVDFSKFQQITHLDEFDFKTGSSEELDISISPDCEAYVAYSSGTTGKPKLIPIYQQGLPGVFESISERLTISNEDSALWNISLEFDPVIAIPGWLLTGGGSLFCVPDKLNRQYETLFSMCRQYQVNIMLMVPSMASFAGKSCGHMLGIKNLRLLFTGEELTKEVLDIYRPYADGGIFNGYGPTEGPIGLTLTKVEENSDTVDIGNAMFDRTYLLVKKGTSDIITAANEEGEICYCSDGFSGYLDNEPETAKKRITIKGHEDELWWRTGDKGSYMNSVDAAPQIDAHLRYIGRLGEFVKVAGVYISFAEVESILHSLDCFSQIKVTSHQHDSSSLPKIVSFCSLKETKTDKEIKKIQLSAQLSVKQHLKRILRHVVVILDEKQVRFKKSDKLDVDALFDDPKVQQCLWPEFYDDKKDTENIIR